MRVGAALGSLYVLALGKTLTHQHVDRAFRHSRRDTLAVAAEAIAFAAHTAVLVGGRIVLQGGRDGLMAIGEVVRHTLGIRDATAAAADAHFTETFHA